MASRKGSPNKNKAFLINRLKDMYGDDFDPIMKMAELCVLQHNQAIETKEPQLVKQATDSWDKMAQYVVPKLKATEVDLTSGGNPIEMPSQITLVAKSE